MKLFNVLFYKSLYSIEVEANNRYEAVKIAKHEYLDNYGMPLLGKCKVTEMELREV